MSCYLCGSNNFKSRKGKVRDQTDLKILECCSCGLVFLDSNVHINGEHYENSGMHGSQPPSIEQWLKNTEIDDERRMIMLKPSLSNKSILDFGCGAGGFLIKTKPFVSRLVGIEPEKRIQNFYDGIMSIYPSIEEVVETKEKFDLITAFHVIEHLTNPRTILSELSSLLLPNGRLIIEVPSSDDALLSLYDCSAFQNFTYWSQHLYLFNSETLRSLISQAGLKLVAIEQFQRYPLSNHLYWLSQGKPGGHQKWCFLDDPELSRAYAKSLASMGRCDTLIAHLELAD